MGREGYVSEARGMPQLRYAVEKISRTRGQRQPRVVVDTGENGQKKNFAEDAANMGFSE